MSDICPECSIDVSEQHLHCPACGEKLIRIRVRPEPPQPRFPQPYDPERGELSQFGIGSLLWFTAAIAVLLGIGRVALGLAIFAIVFLAPAVIRGLVVISRYRAMGFQLHDATKVMHIFAAFGFTGMIALVIGGAFVTAGTCLFASLVLHGGPMEFIIALITAIIVQAGVTSGFIVWSWHYREPIHNRVADVGFIVSWASVAGSTIALASRLIFFESEDQILEHLNGFMFAGGMLLFTPTLIGFICSFVGLYWRPCLLACAGFGISTSHLVAIIVMGTIAKIAIDAGAPNSKTMFIIAIYSILFLSLAISPLIALAMYWRIARSSNKSELAQ